MSVSLGRPAGAVRPRAVVPQRGTQADRGVWLSGRAPCGGAVEMAPGRRVGGSWCASCRRFVASANDRLIVHPYRRALPHHEGARPCTSSSGTRAALLGCGRLAAIVRPSLPLACRQSSRPGWSPPPAGSVKSHRSRRRDRWRPSRTHPGAVRRTPTTGQPGVRSRTCRGLARASLRVTGQRSTDSHDMSTRGRRSRCHMVTPRRLRKATTSRLL